MRDFKFQDQLSQWLSPWAYGLFFSLLFGSPLLFLAFTIRFLLTPLVFIPMLYLAWMVYDKDTPRKGGRRSLWFLNTRFLRLCAQYIPARVHMTTKLDPNRNYVLGYHPHGVVCMGMITTFGFHQNPLLEEAMPGLAMYGATLNFNFNMPIARELWMWLGVIASDREALTYVLSKKGKGNIVGIAVGGAQEALDAVANTMVLTLKNRKGFVKLAITQGVPLLPCICFGENELYNLKRFPETSLVYKFQQIVKRILGFVPIVFYGRGIFQERFGLLPHRKFLHTVVGPPIEVVQNSNPTQKEIDELHSEYLHALVKLFKENKDKYAENPKLELVIK